MKEENMKKTVIKRDGIKRQDFNPEKIRKLIRAANTSNKTKKTRQDQMKSISRCNRVY